jgi:UDP-N-acetylglucosamine 2-epimerase
LKVVSIIGTRPEIIKMFPLFKKLDQNFDHAILHTGQHFDFNMDKVFFRDFKIESKLTRTKSLTGDFGLQFSELTKNVFNYLKIHMPDAVIVQGDTNSALAGALVATRLGIKVIHIEAGCRSGNLSSPEEQNRTLIDTISFLKFCPDKYAYSNLKRSNLHKNTFVSKSTIFDSLFEVEKKIKRIDFKKNKFKKNKFVLFTMHRYENVTDLEVLKKKIKFINNLSTIIPVFFPIHPRTLNMIQENTLELSANINLVEPLPYLEFLGYLRECRFVITDSGGLQEEAAYFDKPCIVLRNETEWRRLVKIGKLFLFPEINKKLDRFINELIFNEAKYKKIQLIKCKESKTGASELIIKKIKSLNKI